jgi:hypothetical protein
VSLYTEIYDFFNEARPRTVNKDVEDIERPGTGRRQGDSDLEGGYKERVVKKYEVTTITDKGVKKDSLLPPFELLQIIKLNPDNKDIKFEDIKVGEKYKYSKKTPGGAEKKGEIILKSKTPKEVGINTDPQKKVRFRDIDVNPEGSKSSYKPGSVHEIEFNNITKGVKQRVYTIYRNITEQDFKDLKKNINAKVTIFVAPSTESNHARDVYYITIPKVKYGTRVGTDYTYFIYLKEDVVKGLTTEQKDKIKLVLVPIKDISDGITKRPLDIYTFTTFLSDKEKEKLKKTKPATTPDYDDIEEPLDVDLSFLSDDEFDEEEPSDEKVPEPEVPKKTDTADEFSKEDKAAASGFVIDNDRILDKIRNNYDKSKTPTLPDAEKKKAKEELGNAVKTLIDKLFNSLEKESERDAAIEYVIKNRLYKDTKAVLYNDIKKMYDNMKSLKESSFLKEEEARKKYLVKTTPGSALDKTLVNSKVAKKNINDEGEVAIGEYIVNLTDKNVRDFKSSKGLESGFRSIEDYIEKPKAAKDMPIDEPKISAADKGPKYPVGITIDGGKEIVANMGVNQILKFAKAENKDINFEDIEVGVPFKFTQKLSVGPARKGVLVLKSKTPLGQKGDTTKTLTTFRADIDKEKDKQDKSDKRDADKAAKEKAKADKPEMKTVVQMGRTISVPVNMGVKMATVNPSDLEYKYYIVDKNDVENYPNGRLLRDANGKPIGTDDRTEAMEMAKKMGSGYSVFQRAEMKAKRVDITEALSKEDIAKLKSTRVSFTIQSDLDPDKQFNISDNVREVKEEKGKVVLTLAEAGVVTFDKEGTGIFKYSKDNKEYQALNVPADINSMIKKALAPAKDDKAAEPKLEAYIRKRIREAIKEAEVSQYWGYQGKDVKKKRLEEYLKRYDWGFQDSDNPYTHANGSAIHAIVSKLVHELVAMGVDAIAIFNSYAPEGYQVSDLDQLDYASDSPLGSQLTQPYNPDSLTARGGRVAEATESEIDAKFADSVPMEQQLKNAEELSKEYMQDRIQFKKKNPNMHHVAQTIGKFIRKASEKETQIDIDPKSQILTALRDISDKELKK